MADIETLAIENDTPVVAGPLTDYNEATGVATLATGLTGATAVKAFWSTTNTHAAVTIHAALELTLVERGTTGIYYGEWDGALLTTHLTASLGLTIYRIVRSASDYRTWKAFIVGHREIA